MVQLAIPRPGVLIGSSLTRRPSWPRRQRLKRFRVSPLRLVASGEAKALQTPFRRHVLITIHQLAIAELGSTLESAEVSAWSQPDEAGDPILLLTMIADANRSELNRARKVILAKIAEAALRWSDRQRNDYSEKIYFELGTVKR